MEKKGPPLLIKIPLDYADALGCDSTHLIHVNAGRRQLSMDLSIKLMDLALADEQTTGLTLLHLRPELKRALPHLCKLCPKNYKPRTVKRAKKKESRAK